ncbi:MAG: Uma2 family endonuclease [Spirochaetota bacterium]
MERMGNPELAPLDHFTYRQYKTWPDSERWELIDGIAWSMSAAPTRRHQGITGYIFVKMYSFLEGKACRVYISPFDVLLPWAEEEDDDVGTVVEPDIVVFCDRSKLTDFGARGAPDLVVEVLSPSTAKKDLNDKFGLYEGRGVREYWVIDPTAWSLAIFHLGGEGIMAGRYDKGEIRERLGDRSPIESKVLPGFVIDVASAFADQD